MGNRYDLIFFRNTLIYFSGDKRTIVLDHMADALYEGGFLILGVSETPAVNHPLLLSRHNMDAFYFQKIQAEAPRVTAPAPRRSPPPLASPAGRQSGGPPTAHTAGSPAETPAGPPGQIPETALKARKKKAITRTKPEGIAALIDDQEGGHPIAGKVPDLLRGTGEGTDAISGDELFAAVIYLLGQEEFSQADKLLSFMEKNPDSRSDSAVFTSFLRGEYHYFNHRKRDAEINYREAAGKNGNFWPAFYRLCTLAMGGNPVQYEYKVRKALESIERGKDLRYEIFIGGFSPDYYHRALEKRLG
jgi:chemotaxis protein methyltransferase CheR